MAKAFTVLSADHTAFVVSDIDHAVAFWVEGLGADLLLEGELSGSMFENITGARGHTARKALVAIAGHKIELLQYSGPNSGGVSPLPYQSGAAHVALIVDDIDAAITRIGEFGWAPQGNVPDGETLPAGAPRVMYVVGPDGATIELIEPAARRLHRQPL